MPGYTPMSAHGGMGQSMGGIGMSMHNPMDMVMGHEQPLQAHQPQQAHQPHQTSDQSLAMNLSDHGMDLSLGGSGLTNSGLGSSSLWLLGSSLDSLAFSWSGRPPEPDHWQPAAGPGPGRAGPRPQLQHRP